MLITLSIYLTIVNVITMMLYGIDKRKAIHHKWRIPEATLLFFTWIGGVIGAIFGMLLFHHKTRKWKFRILVPMALIIWIFLIYAAYCFM